MLAADGVTGTALSQAVAVLSGREFVDEKVPLWVRIARLERLARTPTSIYAFKTVSAPRLMVERAELTSDFGAGLRCVSLCCLHARSFPHILLRSVRSHGR